MFLATKFKQACFALMLVASSFLLISCAETLPPGEGSSGSAFDEATYNALVIDDTWRGGRLYDKWWEVKSLSAPSASNPIWEEVTAQIPSNTNGNNGGQWRCKECHGWDYKGVNGAYGQGSSHYTGIRAFDTSNQAFTAEHVYNMITNGAVDYGTQKDISHKYVGTGFMSSKDAYDLTKFIMDVARIDTANPTLGDVDRGKIVFHNIPNAGDPTWTCETAGCHSEFTTSIPNLDDIIGLSKDNPQEFLHKVRYGSPTGPMPFGMTVIQAQDALAYVAAGAESVTAPSSNFSQATYDSKGRDDVVKGGKLYDKWWTIATNATEPTIKHSRWPASNTTVTGASTWRCKECHGWDYRGADGAYASGKHATGYRGIVNTSSFTMQYTTASDVYSFLKEDTSHGFANLYENEDDYYALTKFIITMRSEVAASQAAVNFIDDETLLAQDGDVNNGKVLYEEKNTITCSNDSCHGIDGKAKDFESDNDPDVFPNEFVHNIAQENPWEFIHKIRFGDAEYSPMPTMYNASDATITTINSAVDLLAYAQINLVPNVKRAGLLYDKWWNVGGVADSTTPTTRNRTWVANDGNTDSTVISDSSTWRCKECHGWDYQGANGAYAQGSKHYSNIRGFLSTLGTTIKDKAIIVDAIKNGTTSTAEDHDFGRFLSDVDIGLLADFIRDPVLGVPSTVFLYDGYLADGNATSGKTIYEEKSPGNCAGCHGVNGTTISTVDIAAVANGNPQEFFHKSRYGQPGSNMLPSSSGFAGLTLEEASNVLAYSKTLSVDPGPTPDPGTYSYATADVVRGGRLYDKWWKEMQATDDTVQSPVDYNPYWAGRSANLPDFPATYTETKKIETSWRCKSCHAWDYKGTGYETGTPSTNGADNLLYKIKLRSESTFVNDDAGLQQHLYDWIKSGLGTSHQFGTASAQIPSAMGERELWDLVRFLLDGGLLDSDSNILSSGIVIGTSNANGDGLYNGSVDADVNCAVCHGANGDTPPPADQGGSGDPLDIFAIAAAADDPWEFLHKTRFGQPGTSMPAVEGTNALTSKDAFDILGYGQQSFNAR